MVVLFGGGYLRIPMLARGLVTVGRGVGAERYHGLTLEIILFALIYI